MPMIRNAMRWDVEKIAGVIAASLLPTRIGGWLDPDPGDRSQHLAEHLLVKVCEALRAGVVRLVEEREQEVVAAAIWLPCDNSVSTRRAAIDGDGFDRRLGRLLAVAEQPHLREPHLRLAAMGVLSWRQRHGLATALLADANALSPAQCLLAIDDAVTALGTRCGFQTYGEPVAMTAADVARPMLHAARGSTVRARNTGSNRYPPSVARAATRSGAP